MISDENIIKIVDAIKNVLPDGYEKAALHEPFFDGNEWDYMKECLDTGWVSSVGKYVDRFEKMLTEYTGVKHAIAVVNGTAALHTCLLLADVKAGDEVLLPAITFVATANAVSYCNAIPHFVDSEFTTLGIDSRKLEDYLTDIARVKPEGTYNRRTGRKISAVVPMHTFGHPVDLDVLADVCQRFNLVLIEDMAESLGSYYKGRHTGHWGKVSALSFNGNKIVTTGGGGAILTNDEELGKKAKYLTTTAKVPHRWEFIHDMVGYNYRMPNINAALGCAQLEQLNMFLDRKRKLAEMYENSLINIRGISFFKEAHYVRSNYWLNAIMLDIADIELRDRVLDLLHWHNIFARPVWKPMHKLPMYMNCPQMDLSAAEYIERCLINLPSSVGLAGGATNETENMRCYRD